MNFIFVAMILGASLMASAVTSVARAAADQKVMEYVLCKNQKVVRTIRITPETGEPQDCQVTYSKAGSDEVVGQSRSLASCQSILGNIQRNLESSKWNCKKVGNAKVSYGSEVTVQ